MMQVERAQTESAALEDETPRLAHILRRLHDQIREQAPPITGP